MDDSIIDEVHEVRAKLWQSCGADWKQLEEHFLQRSAQHPERMVSLAEFKRMRAASEEGSNETNEKPNA